MADRHVWQHCVDEGRGALRHPPTPAARADAAPLTRDRHATLERTLGTPQPREGLGQDPAAQDVAELLLDEPGQAAAVAAVRDFSEEGLQVLPNDGVEHGVLGVAGLIRAVRMDHALG